MEILLSVRGLKTEFLTTRGVVHAVDGVDLDIGKGEVLGIVGESGCGKSVTALSIMYLVSMPPGLIAGGQVWFKGWNLLAGVEAEARVEKKRDRLKIWRDDVLLKRHRARMNKIRGREISMIFQEPMSSLNPVLPAGYQVAEALMYQRRAEICQRLLGRHDLTKDDLALFQKATAAPEAAERDQFVAEFCLRTGLEADRVKALVDAFGLTAAERLERVKLLAARRRSGSIWFLNFLKRLDAAEDAYFLREWEDLSRLSLGQATVDLFNASKNPEASGLPPLARVTPTQDSIRLFFRSTEPNEDLRRRVEAVVRPAEPGPRQVMFHRVREIAIGKGSVDLRFEKLPAERLRLAARYQSLSFVNLLLMRIPVLGQRLMKPIEAEARRSVLDLFKLVRIPEPTKVYSEYPHELSGGMQQRTMIAMALACDPALMIADEPTTALDVTTQAQILRLIKDLRTRINSAILYITHDLAVVAELCDRVVVMYAGKVVEDATVEELFAHPLHPYAQGLLESIVSMDSRKVEPGKPLPTIPGTVPDLRNPPAGCRFHPRCKFAFDRCRVEDPRLLASAPDHRVACHLYDEGGAHAAAP